MTLPDAALPMSPPPPASPAPTRPTRFAATLIVLRDGVRGLEVLMLRRADKDNDQNSGASVFPGGTLDPQDRALHGLCAGIDDAGASSRLGLPAHGLDFHAAAIRECFEEAGLLFACDAGGRLVELDGMAPADIASLRRSVEEGGDAFHRLCSERGWRLAADRLAYFSHWLTPPGMPRRFDTRFFVAMEPPRQAVRPDGRETVEHMWLRPAEALDHARGLKLMNVQQRILEQLAAFDSAAACMANAREARNIPLVMPRLAEGSRGRRPVNPGEPAYEELSRIDPEGLCHGRYELSAGLAMRLSPRVLRVTAPGRGELANSYYVGGEQGDWVLIDGCAGDEAHASAVRASAPGPVRQTLAASGGGWPQGHRIELGGCTLRVELRRLGRGEDVACYLLEEEGMLFVDDAESTVLPEVMGAEWLAPSRGFLVPAPRRAGD